MDNVYPTMSEIDPELRESLIGHRSAVLWLTGLSGSGKSSIARRLEKELVLSGHRVVVLDGDNLRDGLCTDLDFSPAGRRENLRRAAELARLLSGAGIIVIAAFISPYREDREMVAKIIGEDFFEVYIEASVAICAERDTKGLYERAQKGEIADFTGVSSPYEVPERPAMQVQTERYPLRWCVGSLLHQMMNNGLLRSSPVLRYQAKISAIAGQSE